MTRPRLLQIKPITLIIGFALSLRLWQLDRPKGYIFDELYYAKNANSLISNGVELNADGEAEFVVHPPFGKWLIGFGIKVFGNDEFGWRISAALIGTASVFLIYLITQQLFNSIFLSNTAAILMALDGLNLVMSRVALLDIFLMFFILLSFYFLIKEQIWLSGLIIGLAAATKWSAVFLIPFLLLLTINMRVIEPIKWLKRLSQFVFLPAVIYLISWSGWLLTHTGWSRDSTSNPITSLLHYHGEILDFHQGLVEKHAYSANPWSWLILGRPTSFFYESPSNCGAASCAQEILAIGTPILWWSAIFGVAVTVGFFIVKRERVAAIILAGFAGTYLPWFFMQSRTMFYFYAISILPFLILALIYCFKQLLTLGKYEKQISLFVLLVGLNFLFFLPILLGVEIPYSQWLSRMWLPSWI